MILVTGGAGFIGSNLVWALERQGRRVAVCDRLGTGEKWRNLRGRDLVDLIAPAQLDAWLDAEGDRLDAILHLGAVSSTVERDADLIVESNLRLTLHLWRWCARHAVRFIYASSAATYGAGEHGFDDSGDRAALARLVPLNAYGWSKHLTDRRIARLIEDREPRPPQWVGLKLFNVYGPNEYHKGGQQSLVPQLVRQIAETGMARLFRSYREGCADGDQQRDFVWIDDVIDVVGWLLEHPEVCGLLNVGSGRARSFNDLARAVFAAMGRPERIEYIEMPQALRATYQYFTEAPLARLRAAGWDGQTTPLEEGVRRYVQEHLLRDDPYR
jgi:ADP-L-glycero-D-manno-heptose 6-epimerase